MTQWHVYRIDDGGRLLYIGMSKDVANRFRNHKSCKKLSPTATISVMASFDRWRDAWKLEAKFISEMNPPLNSAFKCRKALGRTTMDTKTARKVWRSAPSSMFNYEVLEKMPGWTIGMAMYHFGARSLPEIDRVKSP